MKTLKGKLLVYAGFQTSEANQKPNSSGSLAYYLIDFESKCIEANNGTPKFIVHGHSLTALDEDTNLVAGGNNCQIHDFVHVNLSYMKLMMLVTTVLLTLQLCQFHHGCHAAFAKKLFHWKRSNISK